MAGSVDLYALAKATADKWIRPLVTAGRQDERGKNLSHLLWMCEEIEKSSDCEKANRWIGYVQGVLVAIYGVPLDEVRDLTRSLADLSPAEAADAALKQPVSDEEVEGLAASLGKRAAWLAWLADRSHVADAILMQRAEKHLRRLTASLREKDAQIKAKDEALRKIEEGREVRREDGSTEMVDHDDAAEIAEGK